jgi:hypothetical protein
MGYGFLFDISISSPQLRSTHIPPEYMLYVNDGDDLLYTPGNATFGPGDPPPPPETRTCPHAT